MNKKSLLLLLLSFAMIPLPLPAAVQFWDPDGATVGTSISGNWDTATANWTDTADSGVNSVWTQGNDASFGVEADYTVTLTEPITVGNITLAGSAGTLTLAGTSLNSLTLGASANFSTGGRNLTISAPINGSFDLTRSGSGTLTLSGANTYSGGTTLSGGTTAIEIDSVSSGGVITSGALGTGEVTVMTASTMTASGGPRVIHNPVTLNIALTIGGSQPFTLTNGTFKVNGANRNFTINNTADTILAHSLTDEGTAHTLTKNGTGRLIIMAGDSPTYLGAVAVSAGTLVAGNATPFPTNNNNQVTVNTTGILDLNGFDVRLSRLGGNATGSVLLGTNTLTAGNDASSSEFFGVISGTGGYVKVGSISQVLSGTNTFTGGITIKAGSLYLPTNGVSGLIALGAGPNTITIVESGRIGANKGISMLTNNVVLANVGSLSELDPANPGTVFNLAGQVSGSSGFLRSDKGQGLPILSGNNTFTGGVQVDSRSLMLGHKNALGTGAFTIGNPTTLPAHTIELASAVDLLGTDAITNATTINQSFSLNTTNGIATDSGLELSGPVTLSSGTKTIGASGTGLVKISGVISGSGGIDKAGPNALTLSANNTYTGSTVVSEGALALTNSGSVASSSDITVASGATLDVSGRTDGTLTVNAPQTLGGSGTIIGSAAGGLNMSGGGTDRWQLAALSTTPGDFDQLTLTGGNLVLGGTSKLSVNFTGTASSPHDGDPFWSSAQSWTVLTLSGASNPGNSDFTTVINGVYTNGYFTTSVSAGNVLLNFTPGAPPQPQLTSLTGAGTANVTINFTTAIKGATYQVQYKNDLNDPNWSTLGSVTATGSTASIVDTTDPAPAQRFYRIVVQ